MAEKTVVFKFNIDDAVFCKGTSEHGIVSMLAVDDSGNNSYYVKGEVKDGWWPERLLEASLG